MTGILSNIPDWHPPQTWHTGNKITAATWSSHIYDPLRLMLRRPITIATKSVDTSVASGGLGVTPFSFDTLVTDDDGMMVDDGAATFSDFYAQRDGTYSVYAALPFIGNNSTDATCAAAIFVNGISMYKREATVVGASTTQDHFRAVNGDVSLTEGDKVNVFAWNNTGVAITIKAEFNAPRLVIAWRRPF